MRNPLLPKGPYPAAWLALIIYYIDGILYTRPESSPKRRFLIYGLLIL